MGVCEGWAGAPRNQCERAGRGRAGGLRANGRRTGTLRGAGGGRLPRLRVRGRSQLEFGSRRPAGARVSRAESRSLPSPAAAPREAQEPGRAWGPHLRPPRGEDAGLSSERRDRRERTGAACSRLGGSGAPRSVPGQVRSHGSGVQSRRTGAPGSREGAPREGQCPPRQVTVGGGVQEVLHLVNDSPCSGSGAGPGRLASGEAWSAPGGPTGSPLWGAVLTYPHPRNVWPAGRAGHRLAGRQLGASSVGEGQARGARREGQAGLGIVALPCRSGACPVGPPPWS